MFAAKISHNLSGFSRKNASPATFFTKIAIKIQEGKNCCE
jgi:hypothetical protein